MDLYIVGCTIEPSFIWYIRKCMLIRKFFLFKFCLRELFVKNEDAPRYARPIRGKGALALGQFQLARSFHIHDWKGRKWLRASRCLKIRAKFRITKMQRSKSSVIECERIGRVEIIPVPEYLFREQVARNMVCLHF